MVEQDQNIITKRVWAEMHRAKGYLRQIELYTARKRRGSKLATAIVILSSIICFFSTILDIQTKWPTIISALCTAVAAIYKEVVNLLKQPESELCQLDRIHNFYKSYLRKLEDIYTLRYDISSDMNDEKMLKCFDDITATEGSFDTELSKLQKELTDREKEITDRDTELYFKTIYLNNERES